MIAVQADSAIVHVGVGSVYVEKKDVGVGDFSVSVTVTAMVL
jgi:hypothetical protein